MSTLNEITYNIFNTIRPHLTNDEDLQIEKIEHDVNIKRSLFIRNELNKNRTIDIGIQQSLGCLELELSNPVDCCLPVDVGCVVLRTKERIPNAIELHDKKLITRVAPIVLTERPFTFVSYDRFLNSGNGQYSKDTVYATLFDGRIYLKSNNINIKLLQKINVWGVFEDPREVYKFKTCDDEPCYTADSPYPMNSWMEEYVKKALIEEYFKITLRSGKDNVNDGKSETTDVY